MNRVKNTIWNKKLPSFLGVFFLMFAIGIIAYLSRNAVLFGTKAAASNVPKDVKISNITDTTFTVSYTTDSSVLGSISFGTLGKMDQVALDDRDKPKATPTEHTTHYITVANLAPSTAYTFSITSGSQTFLNQEAAYQVTTVSTQSNPRTSKTTVSGKITQVDGSPASEVLVYLSLNNSQLLSTLTNSSGSYTLDTPTQLSPNTPLTLQAENALNQSQASILAGQANPVPLIILSKNYDFAVSSEPLSPSPMATSSAELSATPSASPVAFPTTAESTGTTPKILTPQKEQGFTDQQPTFKGQAEPGQTVNVTINSTQTITASVKTDANGNWQYRPNQALEPGTHTITIRTIDASGLMRVITQSFVVYAQGSQFTEPSISPSPSTSSSTTPTNSPTSTPQPNATATPTSTPRPSPTATPTSTPQPSPTATPTVKVTATPTPTKKLAQATISVTTPPIPITGNASLMITVIGAVTTIAIGALLFIFTAV